MPMMNNLKLYQKMYDLILYSFPIIDRFPKKQKFVLGQQIENCMIEITKLIVHANKLKSRRSKLFEIDIELEKLRLLVRLAKDLGFMSIKKYGNHAEKINEIGKILGGWMKAT
jgi:four helix bundle protein